MADSLRDTIREALLEEADNLAAAVVERIAGLFREPRPWTQLIAERDTMERLAFQAGEERREARERAEKYRQLLAEWVDGEEGECDPSPKWHHDCRTHLRPGPCVVGRTFAALQESGQVDGEPKDG